MTAKRPGWREPLDDLLDVPAAGAVDVTGANDHPRDAGLPNESLALLLGAPVRSLHGNRRVLVEHRAGGVAGDHGRDEHESGAADGLAGLEQAARPADVDCVDLARVSLGGNFRRQVDHAIGLRRLQGLLECAAIAEVAGGRGGARRMGARAPNQRDDGVAPSQQIGTNGVPEEPARAGDERLHAWRA